MKICKLTATVLAASMAMFVGSAVAHDSGNAGAGTPTCLESNFMLADAQNTPFASKKGKGRVIEMNTTTGQRGLTVNNPFAVFVPGPICEPDNAGGPNHVDCPGPMKPTGIVSGGSNGHAYLTSAAQHSLTEFHRDNTPIKTNPVWLTSPSMTGGNWGWVPRLLGNGFMPNGNIAQTTCNANFFNAGNSDSILAGETDVQGDGNSSWQFFPPVYGTDGPNGRANDGRVLVIDQDTLELVDEYSRPKTGAFANDPRWNCPAGVVFTSDGMYVSMFHGDAIFLIDWDKGASKGGQDHGVNHNKVLNNLDSPPNQADVIKVIDVSNDGTLNAGYALNYDDSAAGPGQYKSGHRRDNLRAIRMSEDGTLFGTRRSRSRECNRGEAPGTGVAMPCNPTVFRQHVFTVKPGSNVRSGSIALDPGVNVIAGITINRMSGPGCKFITGLDPTTVIGNDCGVETLYVGVSAGNAGCPAVGIPPASPNICFEPRAGMGTGWNGTGGGGTVYEYLIDEASWDATNGTCTGVPGGSNAGCALPIAQFEFTTTPGGAIEKLDPRMVMTIHEAFTQ